MENNNQNKQLSRNDGNTMLSPADFTQSKEDNYFYTSKNPLLRYKIVKDYDPIFGGSIGIIDLRF